MSLFNCFGGFSFRGFSFVSVLVGLFSWFVLHNQDATVFFGLAALISLMVHCNRKDTTDELRDMERHFDTAIEQLSNDQSRDRQDLYNYVDSAVRDYSVDCSSKNCKR